LRMGDFFSDRRSLSGETVDRVSPLPIENRRRELFTLPFLIGDQAGGFMASGVLPLRVS
jgi:hypothetical protein